MSKRSPGLPQRPRGFWPTPKAAVAPLIPYLPERARYGEPCAGDGQLIRNLSDLWPGGECVWKTDIHPERHPDGPAIDETDALDIVAGHAGEVDLWISNPPWPKIGQRGDPALGIILHLVTIAPCWMLLPWDFAANDYFKRVIFLCSDIVPVGRVKWIPDSKDTGKDNCAWYRFSVGNCFPPAVRPRA